MLQTSESGCYMQLEKDTFVVNLCITVEPRSIIFQADGETKRRMREND
jgi:hypothetical protein